MGKSLRVVLGSRRTPAAAAFWWWISSCLFTSPLLAASSYQIDTIAGTDAVGDNGPAGSASLLGAEGVCADTKGNIYVADTAGNRVRKIDPSGTITSIAGTGAAGFSGDGGPATLAQLQQPYGISVDPAGNLYIADLGNNRIRKVTPDGLIATFPTAPPILNSPRNVLADRAGNVYIAEFGGARILRIDARGAITVVAGTGYSGFDSESGPATASRINGPAGMFLDSAGVLYFADSGNGRIRKVANGTLTTHLGGTSDSTANPALLYLPTAVLVDPAGVVYVADTGNHRIRKLNPNLTITTVAGNGHDLAFDLNGSILEAGGTILQRLTPGNTLVTIIGNVLFSFHGDGGPATNAALNIPVGVASDGASALWVSDFGNGRVRRISPDGIISTVAGGLITDTLQRPSGLALDSNGTLYVTDPAIDEIMQMPLNGRLTNIAGTGSPGSSGDGGPARFAMLSSPSGIAIDGVGQVIIADTGNNRLRRIKTDGTMAPFAGNAQLLTPTGLCSGLNGDIFVADTGNHMVRRIAVDGTVSALAGNGVQGYSGDTGSANAASLDAPRGCAVDPQGNVFIADTGNHVIRLVTLDGKIWTIAGTGTPGFSGDGGLALQAALHSPCSVALDTNGTVYVADKDNNRIRRLKPVGLSFGEITQTIGYANGASQQSGPVAPGSLISIFGSGLGPLMAIPGTLQSPGVLANQLGDTQVLFDGIPGALLLVQDSQINAVVPFEVAGRMASKVEVRRSGLAIGSTTVPIAAVAPGLFTLDAGTGLAFAFNADGSANSSNNPAAQGTAVTLYGTGGGQTFPAGTDGRVPDASPYPLVLPVSATIAGQPANVAWAGETPGQAGVNTFQLTVPSTAPTGPQPVVLMIGGMSSQPGALIYVQ